MIIVYIWYNIEQNIEKHRIAISDLFEWIIKKKVQTSNPSIKITYKNPSLNIQPQLVFDYEYKMYSIDVERRAIYPP